MTPSVNFLTSRAPPRRPSPRRCASTASRLGEAEKLAAVDGVKIVALPYDHDEWLREVAAGYEHEPEKGARCARCFRYNLTKAAEYAKAHGFDEFTTSLTVSPHKVSQMIFDAAKSLASPIISYQLPTQMAE